MLSDIREKVADHEGGRKLLEDEEYETFKKRIGLFERKLEKMSEEPDERVCGTEDVFCVNSKAEPRMITLTLSLSLSLLNSCVQRKEIKRMLDREQMRAERYSHVEL